MIGCLPVTCSTLSSVIGCLWASAERRFWFYSCSHEFNYQTFNWNIFFIVLLTCLWLLLYHLLPRPRFMLWKHGGAILWFRCLQPCGNRLSRGPLEALNVCVCVCGLFNIPVCVSELLNVKRLYWCERWWISLVIKWACGWEVTGSNPLNGWKASDFYLEQVMHETVCRSQLKLITHTHTHTHTHQK